MSIAGRGSSPSRRSHDPEVVEATGHVGMLGAKLASRMARARWWASRAAGNSPSGAAQPEVIEVAGRVGVVGAEPGLQDDLGALVGVAAAGTSPRHPSLPRGC